MRLAALALAALAMLSTAYASGDGGSSLTEKSSETGGKKRLSDAQIKQLLIDESIAAYDGNCPCPYSHARNGSRCGKRSAYSREGGAAPLCYPDDVTREMVQAYRDAHGDE